MKLITCLTALVLVASAVNGQELFVFTEPASNMPAKSIGIRITNEGMLSNGGNRTMPEVMIGFNKNFMAHVQGFLSNMDGDYRVEGASIYGKYRFLSVDGTQSHLRAAAYGRYSLSRRNFQSEDVNLEGDNSGIQAGVVFTQLLHKLALSGNLNYSIPDTKSGTNQDRIDADQMLGYSLSSGYLLYPVTYKDYKQPNLNLYLEVLGKTNPASGHSYVDVAPAIQLILNSRTRIDLGYRFQLAGNMENRYLKNMYLLRTEFNFFNAIK